MLDLPMKTQPGTEFVYNSGGTMLLSGIISKATGMTRKTLHNLTSLSFLEFQVGTGEPNRTKLPILVGVLTYARAIW